MANVEGFTFSNTDDITGDRLNTTIRDAIIDLANNVSGELDGSNIEAGTITGDKLVDGTITSDKLAAASIANGHLTGMELTNDSGDTAHDIEIGTGQCTDFANTQYFSLSSALTKKIDEDWTEGDNEGGFPSALTLSSNTTYIVYEIFKTDGTVDGGFDTSTTAANLLSDASGDGYTLYREIGRVKTDSSSNIIPFNQTYDFFDWSDEPSAADYSASPAQDVVTTVTLRIPTGKKYLAKISVEGNVPGGTGSNATCKFWDPDTTDRSDADTIQADFDTSTNGNASELNVMTNTSGQIKFMSNGGCDMQISCKGWFDTRGK